MANCNYNTLLASGVQFLQLGGDLSQVARLVMLKQIVTTVNPSADVSTDVLLRNGGCFSCLTGFEMRMIKLQMMCQISGGGSVTV
jgi:hypothetical protein